VPRVAGSLAAEVAAALMARAGSDDVAFLIQRETVYFARGAGSLRPAATVLVQGIYAAWPRDAHFLVRNTIHATRAPGPFALGMVKVAAKRLHVVEPLAGERAPLPPLVPVSFEPPRPATIAERPRGLSPEEWLRFAASLVGPLREELPRHARDRRVGAALVSPEGELLGASANTNGANRTLHAELNVLAAQERPVPAGSALYVTLRPCKMCAGLLWESSAAPGSVRVVFAEDDPGSAARNTVLCPGSEMRARFARSRAEREAPGPLRLLYCESP